MMIKMKRLFKFRYPKLLAFVLIIIAAYFIFSNPTVSNFMLMLNGWGYFGAFISGMFFTLGFTSPISAGFFITLNPENIWLAGILGGIGAMLMDLLIFKFIRFSFMDEFKRLKHTKTMKELNYLIENTFGHKIKIYLMYALTGFFIASPLPDEAGVIMLAGLTKIKANVLAVISFILNTLGILFLLWI